MVLISIVYNCQHPAAISKMFMLLYKIFVQSYSKLLVQSCHEPLMRQVWQNRRNISIDYRKLTHNQSVCLIVNMFVAWPLSSRGLLYFGISPLTHEKLLIHHTRVEWYRDTTSSKGLPKKRTSYLLWSRHFSLLSFASALATSAAASVIVLPRPQSNQTGRNAEGQLTAAA